MNPDDRFAIDRPSALLKASHAANHHQDDVKAADAPLIHLEGLLHQQTESVAALHASVSDLLDALCPLIGSLQAETSALVRDPDLPRALEALLTNTVNLADDARRLNRASDALRHGPGSGALPF